MKYEVDTVKGFQDFLPPESIKRREIKRIIEKNFKLYGFLPVETPIIEQDALMESDYLPNEGTDQAISDRFKLQDRGKRNLGLRYEFTFQLARIFKQNPNIKLPFKRYQIGPVFRDEPTTQNRFRQFTQCDADIIGPQSVESDAECLALISDILKELKIDDAEIQINNRALLTSIIESVEIKNVKQVMRELDKIEKIGEDEVKLNLKRYTSTNQIITLFKILKKSIEFYEENAFSGVSEIQRLLELCRKYEIKVLFNPFMVRGLGYYTGNIFEIKEPNGSSIAAGGRYDKVIGKYLNKEIPAVGISFGLERISQMSKITPKSPVKALLISIEQEKETINLAKSLRKNNISISLTFDKPGKALDYANSMQIPYVLFLGKEETKEKKLKIKDMNSGEEKLLDESQLIKKLSK